jgi:glucosamine kinase
MRDDHPRPTYFMGVDGGGSRCRARLRDGEGRLLASVHGGAANVHVDFDGAVATIRKCVENALDQAGLDRSSRGRLRLGLGLAGASSRMVAEQVEAALEGWMEVKVVNDAVTACLGAHAGQDGGLIIAGTGSAGVARVAGVDTIIGGRGFMLGDDGSGARIGHSAWRRALRAHDGLEPATDFTRKLMAQYDDDPVAVIRWAQRARPSDYGAYAPATFAAASAGDPVALDTVHEAATALSDLALAVRALGADRLSMVGGVADAVRPYLVPEVADALSTPMMDALEGAILLVDGPAPYRPRPRDAGP